MNVTLLILMGALLLFLIVTSYVIASFGITAFFGAPFVATKQNLSKKAFKKAGLKEGMSVMDIGCGDGAVLKVAKEAGAGALIGYELNPILARWARFRLRKMDASIERVNMLKKELEQVDFVFMYLFPKAVEQLKKPLSQLSPMTKILSRGFPFKDVIPMRSFVVDGSHFYVYLARDLAPKE